MKIIGEDNLVVEKTAGSGYCLATGTVVVGGEDGVRERYFEAALTADGALKDMEFNVGVVKTGLNHESKHSNSNNAWFLWAYNGGLYGNGKSQDDAQGELKVGDRVGVLVDLDGEGGDGGSVRFFVNGSEYGPGFKSGVVGPVVLGVEFCNKSQKVTLLPDAEKPAGV